MLKSMSKLIEELNAVEEEHRFKIAVDTLATLTTTISENLKTKERLILWETLAKSVLLSSGVKVSRNRYIQ